MQEPQVRRSSIIFIRRSGSNSSAFYIGKHMQASVTPLLGVHALVKKGSASVREYPYPAIITVVVTFLGEHLCAYCMLFSLHEY